MSESQTTNVEEKTTNQTDSTGESNEQNQEGGTSQKNEGTEEQITISKKELETFKKKAEDFDGLIAKQRAEKLRVKTTTETKSTESSNDDDILKKAEEVARKVALEVQVATKKKDYETNLTSAYKKVSNRFKWLNSDEAVEVVKKHFADNGDFEEEKLEAHLTAAVMHAFPDQYSKAIEEEIKSKVLSESANISTATGGGVSVKKGMAPDKQFSAADLALLQRHNIKPEDVKTN